MCYSAAAAGVPDLARPFAPLILRAELRARARPIQNRQQPVCSMFPASHSKTPKSKSNPHRMAEPSLHREQHRACA